MILNLRHLIGSADVMICLSGKWVRCVPLPPRSRRRFNLRGAIAVLRGQAHAVSWPVPGELEAVLESDINPFAQLAWLATNPPLVEVE